MIMPTIPATLEADVGGLRFKVSSGKSMWPYLKKQPGGGGGPRDSSGRIPAWQVQGPEFNPQHHQQN
jgi:hypothetical protein